MILDKKLDLSSIKRIISEHHTDLQKRGVKSLSVFGSVARGENTPFSDVDLLVEFDQPIGIFDFIRLKNDLETFIGCKVDLVTPDALRPCMRETILKEAIDVSR